MSENTKRSTFLVDEQTLEEAKSKLDRGELSKELRQTVQRLAHGTDVAEETRLTDRLQTLREDRRGLRQERDNIECELDEINRKIERVEQRLDNLRDQQGEYDGVLAMLEEDLHSGIRILGGSDKVAKAASIGDCDKGDVIDDLKERNPDVPAKAFREPTPGEPGNWQSDDSETLL